MVRHQLNAPYGGTLVQRLADRAGVDMAAPVLELDSIAESDLINIATGAFSPLTGFMDSRTFESVCTSNRLDREGLPWTIPIVLDISEAERSAVRGCSRVLLKSSTTQAWLGWIEPSEVFAHDKALHVRSTFGTDAPDHPGARHVLSMKPYLLGGDVTVFRDGLSDDPLLYPAGVREHLARKGLFQVAGFQTRNVVHRAHEYLQRVALEVVGGLLVHPVIGWKKAGDFRPEAVQTAYRYFIDAYYPKDKVVLAFLRLAMRYAGPREAVLHALVRKNFGCSHFIVGRDHAGVGGYYDTYAAHEIFETLPDLGIEILRLREPFHCSVCDGVTTDRTCGHGEASREYISGMKIRKILNEGSDPAGHIFRGDVLSALGVFEKKDLFYE